MAEYKKYIMQHSQDYRHMKVDGKHDVLLIESNNGMDVAYGLFETIDDDMLDLTPEEISKLPTINIPAISLRQCKEQLIRTGRYNDVINIINNIPEDGNNTKAIVKNYWENSQEFERNHPLLGMVTTALGMSEIEVDNFFTAAYKL